MDLTNDTTSRKSQKRNGSPQLYDFSISRYNFYGTDTISENVKNNLDSIEISKKEKDSSSDTKNGQETSPQFESLSDNAKSGLDTNFDTDDLQPLSTNSFEKQEQMLGGGKGIKCLRNKRVKKHHPKKGQNKHEEDKIPSGDDIVQL